MAVRSMQRLVSIVTPLDRLRSTVALVGRPSGSSASTNMARVPGGFFSVACRVKQQAKAGCSLPRLAKVLALRSPAFTSLVLWALLKIVPLLTWRSRSGVPLSQSASSVGAFGAIGGRGLLVPGSLVLGLPSVGWPWDGVGTTGLATAGPALAAGGGCARLAWERASPAGPQFAARSKAAAIAVQLAIGEVCTRFTGGATVHGLL
jgi:hypothetical protein